MPLLRVAERLIYLPERLDALLEARATKCWVVFRRTINLPLAVLRTRFDKVLFVLAFGIFIL